MSEFKFACPVCGQHITSDSSATGSQLDCPTCFRKIVVPQASSSADPKFVLSASEVSKPRPLPSAPAAATQPVQTSPARRKPITAVIVVVLVLACAAAATVYFFPEQWFSKDAQKQAATNSIVRKPAVVYPPATNNLPWTLNLTNASFPEGVASGRIRHRDFACDRAVLHGGTLHLRMGSNWPPELGISVNLFARHAEELAGKLLIVTTNNVRSPTVVLRWKENGRALTETFTNEFALKLEFGKQEDKRMSGNIYICLPDTAQSRIAGSFDAEVRTPSQSKSR